MATVLQVAFPENKNEPIILHLPIFSDARDGGQCRRNGTSTNMQLNNINTTFIVLNLMVVSNGVNNQFLLCLPVCSTVVTRIHMCLCNYFK